MLKVTISCWESVLNVSSALDPLEHAIELSLEEAMASQVFIENHILNLKLPLI